MSTGLVSTGPLSSAIFSLCLPLCVSVPGSSSYKDNTHIGLGSTLKTLISSVKTLSPNTVTPEALEARTSIDRRWVGTQFSPQHKERDSIIQDPESLPFLVNADLITSEFHARLSKLQAPELAPQTSAQWQGLCKTYGIFETKLFQVFPLKFS